MPWESIGDCGTIGSKSWMRVQREWAIAYIKEVCGEPPKGCEVGEMWEDSDFGPAATIGLCWDRMEIDDAPWDYINKAIVALRAMDDAINWSKLDPEDVQERFPKDEDQDTEEDE